VVRVGSAAARERWLAVDERPGDGRAALVALAPVLLVPCLVGDDAPGGDAGAAWLEAGAFIHALALAVRAQGLAAAWIPAEPSRRRAAASTLDLPGGWLPLGALVAGHPEAATAPPPRAPRPPVLDR
jgi:coenzyme F420-0:L-glutamate ligase/coenzyme F420-1:gamma-L-glutamate ligase